MVQGHNPVLFKFLGKPFHLRWFARVFLFPNPMRVAQGLSLGRVITTVCRAGSRGKAKFKDTSTLQKIKVFLLQLL